MDLARKNLRCLDGQKPGFCSEARRIFRPVCPRSTLSQLNCIWIRKTSVDSEISIIDFLGVERWKYRERESKKKQISWAHKGIAPMTMHHQVVSWMQFFTPLPRGSVSRQQTKISNIRCHHRSPPSVNAFAAWLSFSSMERQPASLSSGRMPRGMFSQSMEPQRRNRRKIITPEEQRIRCQDNQGVLIKRQLRYRAG